MVLLLLLFFRYVLLLLVFAAAAAAAAALELAGAHLAAAIAVANVDVHPALPVDAAHVDVALEEHVVHEQKCADERGSLLRRQARVVHLQLVEVRVRQHLPHGAAERLGLHLGDGGDVSDVVRHAAVLVDAFHPEGLVAAQLGAPAEDCGAFDSRKLLVVVEGTVHHLDSGGKTSDAGSEEQSFCLNA